MNADADKNPLAAKVVRGLRQVGKRTRRWRKTDSTFFESCTALDLNSWPAEAFPGVLVGQLASDLIERLVADSQPRMICRLGTTEAAVMSAGSTSLTFGNAFRLLAGDGAVRDIGLTHNILDSLCQSSGFFPQDYDLVRRFVERMRADLELADVLAVWCRQEKNFERELASAHRIRFRDLEPYMHDRPWSRALAGKRLLVVHPFAKSIEQQYRVNRSHLFSNPAVLPEFELTVIPAVQSIANTSVSFANWFDALRHMEDAMSALQWDVAIIGCGAYGLPLAAHAKRLGRKAIHLGGQTQLLFGIKGKRWETGHDRIRSMFNDHWVYPLDEERPSGFRCVEGGAYW